MDKYNPEFNRQRASQGVGLLDRGRVPEGFVQIAEYEMSLRGLRKLWVAQTVGDFTITNLVVYAVYGGSQVTQVPPGASFEVHADYNIRNATAGTLDYWTTCMTVWDVTKSRPETSAGPGYDTYGQHRGSGTLSASDAINAYGPTASTNYRIRIFANQAANAGAPPTSQW